MALFFKTFGPFLLGIAAGNVVAFVGIALPPGGTLIPILTIILSIVGFVRTYSARHSYLFGSSLTLMKARATKRFKGFHWHLIESLFASIVLWFVGVLDLGGQPISFPILVFTTTWMSCRFLINSKNIRLLHKIALLDNAVEKLPTRSQ